MHFACNEKNFEIFKMIYDLYISENLIDIYMNEKDEYGYTPFIHAVSINNLTIIKFLLKNRSDIKINELDNNGNNAIMDASDYETIEFLFENGSKINIENNNGERLIDNIISSPINIEEKHKIINYLLENGANIRNSKGQNLLMVASKKINNETLQFLLNKRLMDINEQDNEGNTALMYAINYKPLLNRKKRYEFIKLLLDSGADDTIVNNKGQTFMSIGKQKFPDFEEKIKEIKRLRDIEYISHLYLKGEDKVKDDDYTKFFNEYISTVQDPRNIFKEIMKFR
jgi:ankyrin repeat protein